MIYFSKIKKNIPKVNFFSKTQGKNSKTQGKNSKTQGKNPKLKEKTQPLGFSVLALDPNWCLKNMPVLGGPLVKFSKIGTIQYYSPCGPKEGPHQKFLLTIVVAHI